MRIDFRFVDIHRILHRSFNCLWRDLVKDDTIYRYIFAFFPYRIAEMIGNSFPFAVIITCEKDVLGVLCILLQFFEQLGSTAYRDIFGLKAVLDVDCNA